VGDRYAVRSRGLQRSSWADKVKIGHMDPNEPDGIELRASFYDCFDPRLQYDDWRFFTALKIPTHIPTLESLSAGHQVITRSNLELPPDLIVLSPFRVFLEGSEPCDEYRPLLWAARIVPLFLAGLTKLRRFFH
jgi:hypothetical protein